MMEKASLRAAQPADVAAIVGLVNGHAATGVMLPVTAERVALALEDFIVAVDARDRVRACGALKEYSPSLAEIASLAVARDAPDWVSESSASSKHLHACAASTSCSH